MNAKLKKIPGKHLVFVKYCARSLLLRRVGLQQRRYRQPAHRLRSNLHSGERRGAGCVLSAIATYGWWTRRSSLPADAGRFSEPGGARNRRSSGQRVTPYTSSTSARRISATLQAWAMQPRGVWGESPSRISEIFRGPLRSDDPERNQPEPCLFGGVGRAFNPVGLDERGDERAEQPGPNGALVVTGIALDGVAVAMRRDTRIARRQRSRPTVGEQFALASRQGAARADRAGPSCSRATSAIDLVGANGRIAVIAVDHVVEAAGIFVPEPRIKALRGRSARCRPRGARLRHRRNGARATR